MNSVTGVGYRLSDHAALKATPSRADGLGFHEELKLRHKYVSLIQNAGRCLDLTQLSIGTAASYFHRFYAKYSFKKEDPDLMAQASLFVACKSEEEIRRCRDIVNIWYAIKHPEDPLLCISKEFWDAKDRLLAAEARLIAALDFDLTVVKPHQHLLLMCKDLKVPVAVAQLSWSVCNDSFLTSLCLLEQPHVIAAAAVHLACALLSFEPKQEGVWWSQFDIQKPRLESTCLVLIDLYESKMPVTTGWNWGTETKAPASVPRAPSPALDTRAGGAAQYNPDSPSISSTTPVTVDEDMEGFTLDDEAEDEDDSLGQEPMHSSLDMLAGYGHGGSGGECEDELEGYVDEEEDERLARPARGAPVGRSFSPPVPPAGADAFELEPPPAKRQRVDLTNDPDTPEHKTQAHEDDAEIDPFNPGGLLSGYIAMVPGGYVDLDGNG